MNNYIKAVVYSQFDSVDDLFQATKIHLEHIFVELQNVCSGKYRDMINMFDGVLLETMLLTIKNWAPPSCKDYDNGDGWRSKIDPTTTNCCVCWFYWVISKQIINDSGGSWTKQMKQLSRR